MDSDDRISDSSRREFLQTMGAAALFAGLPRGSGSVHQIQTLGVQLYTVRDELPKDFDGTLARIASIGYREVEFAGYFGRSPADVKASLDRHNLAAPSAHIDYKTVTDGMDQAVDVAHEIGHKYLVNPWIDEDIRKQPGSWQRAAEAFNRAGETARKAGIQFAYHNHFFEFLPLANGALPYDILLQECEPALVKMELDLCWIEVGGKDPLAYFAKYPGRFPLVHVKGLKQIPKAAPGHEMTFEDAFPDISEVGDGPIDWKRIFSRSDQAGIKHYFVEQDLSKSPFDSIRASFQYLSRLRF